MALAILAVYTARAGQEQTVHDAIDAHRASPHFTQYIRGLAMPALESREVSLWRTSD